MASLRLLLGAVLLISSYAAASYVPGTPGAAWTKEELIIVKAKLYRLYKDRRLAPKAVRLGFHDCLRYADGTGGCDGCLNSHNVGRVLDVKWASKSAPNVEETDNNGLGGIAKRLEKIYRQTNWPWNSPKLAKSLFETGKSRADLWAYAATVAVEFGIDWNNIACKNNTDPRINRLSCIHDDGPDCEVNLSRPFKFEYGRADCTDHDQEKKYFTTKKEHHPSPLSNGKDTADFFKKEFDFSGRDTVAIMGAHTFGRMHFSKSLFPYMWTSSGEDLFNNDYYKMIVEKQRWFYDDGKCTKIGDAYGQKPKTRWMAHARQATQRGGPIFWILENNVCPNANKPKHLSKFDQDCLNEAPSGMMCKADSPAGETRPRNKEEEDGDGNRGCERYRFIVGRDEMLLNSDMGLYKNFQVVDGVFYGCPGLEHFNETMRNTNYIAWSRLPGKGRAEPLCEKETYAVPAGSEPLSSIMEEFAANQNKWISDYQKAHEKMLKNGLTTQLTGAPDHFTGVKCDMPIGNAHSLCYESDTDSDQPPFMIGNRMTENNGLALEANPTNNVPSFLPQNSSSPYQQWTLSSSGNHLINMGTGKPLVAYGAYFLKFENDSTGDFFIVDSITGKVADAYNAREGRGLGIWTRHGAPWQKFYIIHNM